MKRYGPAILTGAMAALAFPKWSLFWLAWAALAPLLLSTLTATPRQAFGRFFLAGWVFHSLLLHWLMTNVYWAGGWAFVGYQAICAILALYWGLTGLLWAWIRMHLPRWGALVAFPVLWMAMEFAQSRLFSGFGWSSLGYSQGNDLLLLQWAAFGGGILVSGILVLSSSLIAGGFHARGAARAAYWAVAVLVIAAVHGLGALWMGAPEFASPPFRVGLIQTDFPLEMKHDPEYAEEMVRNAAEKSRLLWEREPLDLFVWPEAAVMANIHDPAVFERLTALTHDTGASLFTGGERLSEDSSAYMNSSFLVTPAAEVPEFYDKVHLAPFGEYVPFSKYFPFIKQIVPAIGDVGAGGELKTMETGARRFGPLICFEVLFPHMALQLRDMGADCIVIITNLGWFGASAAIPQEFDIARMRAVETRLPVIHCANTGISGVFDPYGRFQMVDGIYQNGQIFKTRAEVTPEMTIMRRMGGALPVPTPAGQAWPGGPRWFPWLAVAGAGIFVLGALAARRRRSGQ